MNVVRSVHLGQTRLDTLQGRPIDFLVLIRNLSDDLFDDVLDRDQPRCPPNSSSTMAI